MNNLMDTKTILESLLGVRSSFTTLADKFKNLSERQSEILGIIRGETNWKFETVNNLDAPTSFTDEEYVKKLIDILDKRDPICQMESIIKLMTKLGEVIESCENKIEKIDERIKLQRKQDDDYKKSNEYKVSRTMKQKLTDNALVLVDRYYMLIKLFYKARKAWLNRMYGLTEKLVIKCKANQYLYKNKIKESFIDQKRLLDDILNLDTQLTMQGK